MYIRFFSFIFLFFSLFLPEISFAQIVQNAEMMKSFSTSSAEKSIDIPEGFTALGALDLPEDAKILIKTEHTPWQELHAESDGIEKAQKSSDLVFFNKKNPSHQFFFKIQGTTARKEFSFFFLNENFLAEKPLLSASSGNFQNSYPRDWNFFKEMGIVSRENWGADESLRISNKEMPEESVSGSTAKGQECIRKMTLYPEDFSDSGTVKKDGENFLTWPYKYSSKIKKIVVHHTAEDGFKDGRSAESVMRAIYSYHAQGRGWGDIGYNFVIAPNGQIFEGRAGGDFVVGGHVFCGNTQTIGISLMGNFQDAVPEEAQILALEKLISGLSEKYNIDVSAESSFQGKFTANVVGHQDYGATACPGKFLYELIPSIRNKTGFLSGNKSATKHSAQFVGKISLLALPAEGQKNFTFSFKNTGNMIWKKDTWLYADLPTTDVSVQSADGKNDFFAARLNENEVAPQGIGTFTVQVMSGIQGGLHTIEFTPVVDSRRVENASVVLPVETKDGKISNRIVSSTFTKTEGNMLNVDVLLQNTGNIAWRNQSTALEVKLEKEKYEVYLRENTVLKGEFAHFSGAIPLPSTKKSSLKLFAYMTKNGKKIGSVKQMKTKIPMGNNSADSVSVEGAAFAGKMEGSVSGTLPSAFSVGSVPEKYFHIQNTGSVPWKQNEVFLEVSGNGMNEKIFPFEDTIFPSQTGTFYFRAKDGLEKNTTLQLELKNAANTKSFSSTQWDIRLLQKPVDTTQPTTLTDDKKIRIRLEHSAASALITGLDFQIMGDGKFLTLSAQNADIVKKGEKILVNGYSADVVRLQPKNISDILTITSWSRPLEWNASLNDNAFRGNLEFRVMDGQLVVINELLMRDYLKGLAEVSNSAPLEKQKALAVIARSYAAFYLSNENRKYPGMPYDGDDSPASFQKYRGYGYEKRSQNFSNAVEETNNEVIVFNGNVVKTPYFSESDGTTLSAEEVWGWSNTPYLQSVDDHFCKDGKGTKQGHGVGLSGCGAESMANAGFSYVDILKYYYKGIEVETR